MDTELAGQQRIKIREQYKVQFDKIYRSVEDSHTTQDEQDIKKFLKWFHEVYKPKTNTIKRQFEHELYKTFHHTEVSLANRIETEQKFLFQEYQSCNPHARFEGKVRSMIEQYYKLQEAGSQPRAMSTGYVFFSAKDALYTSAYNVIEYLYNSIFLDNMSWDEAMTDYNTWLSSRRCKSLVVEQDIAFLQYRIEELRLIKENTSLFNLINKNYKQYEEFLDSMIDTVIQDPESLAEFMNRLQHKFSKPNKDYAIGSLLWMQKGVSVVSIVQKARGKWEVIFYRLNNLQPLGYIEDIDFYAIGGSKYLINIPDKCFAIRTLPGKRPLFKEVKSAITPEGKAEIKRISDLCNALFCLNL